MFYFILWYLSGLIISACMIYYIVNVDKDDVTLENITVASLISIIGPFMIIIVGIIFLGGSGDKVIFKAKDK
jgi:hypothetical protein